MSASRHIACRLLEQATCIELSRSICSETAATGTAQERSWRTERVTVVLKIACSGKKIEREIREKEGEKIGRIEKIVTDDSWELTWLCRRNIDSARPASRRGKRRCHWHSHRWHRCRDHRSCPRSATTGRRTRRRLRAPSNRREPPTTGTAPRTRWLSRRYHSCVDADRDDRCDANKKKNDDNDDDAPRRRGRRRTSIAAATGLSDDTWTYIGTKTSARSLPFW